MPNEWLEFEKIEVEDPLGHQNLTAHRNEDSPSSGITLRAKALRVMLEIGGEAPFQVLSPRQGRKKSI